MVEEVIQIHEHRDDSKDSLEISTPAKGGCVKVYGDFNKPEEFEKKIKNAFELREKAQVLLEK